MPETPLILYFGTYARTEFYEPLLGKDVRLGLLRDLDNPKLTVEPPEFAVVERIPFSLGVDQICERVRRIQRDWRVESILNFDENTVLWWAMVCERLGLPAISPETATLLRDKTAMRAALNERLPSEYGCASHPVTSAEDVRKAAARTGLPAIIKPNNLTGSFFVRRCDTEDSLLAAYHELDRVLADYCAETRVNDVPVEIMVEEYLVGSNHSVDCAVLDGEVWSTPVVDVLTGIDLGGNDFHHYGRSAPSRLHAEDAARMRALAEASAHALGVERGCLHVEFVQGPNGPRIIEVGGRPGVSRAPMLADTYGMDLITAYRDVLRGRRPDLVARPSGASAVITPFPPRAGKLVAYHGLDRIRALPSTYRVELYRHPGDHCDTRLSGAAFPVRILMRADDPAQLAADFDRVCELTRTLFVLD